MQNWPQNRRFCIIDPNLALILPLFTPLVGLTPTHGLTGACFVLICLPIHSRNPYMELPRIKRKIALKRYQQI